MSDGLTISEISMQNDIRRLETVSHNLANVNTPGYKRQIVNTTGFQTYMDTARLEGIAQQQYSRYLSQSPRVSTVTDSVSGAMKFTGRPLDLVTTGNVYLAVNSPQGELYTRQGDLHIDAMGRLVTAGGLPVMGLGGEIRLTTDKPHINQQGQIFVDEQIVAELKLIELEAGEDLQALGGGLYQAGSSGQVLQNDGQLIRQGYVEASNVNMTQEMVKMIELTRHFESTQKLIKGYDDMMDRAINDIGDFQGF